MYDTKNQKKEALLSSVLDACKDKFLEKIKEKVQNGLDPFNAYDQVLDEFELEEEIALIYDLKAEKEPDVSDNMDLLPDDIERIKEKIKTNIFAELMKEYEGVDS